MKLSFMVSLLLPLTVACGGTPTWESASRPPFVASVRDITVGDRVAWEFGNIPLGLRAQHHFFIAAPSSGRLEVALHWDDGPASPYASVVLRLGPQDYTSTAVGFQLEGFFQVEAGQRCHLIVELGGDWRKTDHFVLTSRIGGS